MEYVYIKDSEGFTIKKKADEVLSDDIIITKTEHEELSGIAYYKKTFMKGGKRAGSGRKKEFVQKIRINIDLEKSELDFISQLAKEKNISKNKIVRLAINNLKTA
jgi:hypothetical protein